MKELTKIQVAILKRNIQNVKPFKKRVAKLEKIAGDAQAEIVGLQEQIKRYEEIEKEMTGGLSGEEYLNSLNEIPVIDPIMDDLQDAEPTNTTPA